MLPTRRPLRTAAALALLVMPLALPALPAGAHAVLVSSSPSAGERVDTVPEQIVLEFSETVEAEFGQLQVSGPDGRRLDQEPPTADGTTVTTPVAAATAPGEHTIAYRVISADGHPVEGQLTYEISEAALSEGSAAGSPATEDDQGAGASGSDEDAAGGAPSAPAPGGPDVPGPGATEPAAADGEGGVGLLPIAVVAAVLLLALGVVLARRGEDEVEPGASD